MVSRIITEILSLNLPFRLQSGEFAKNFSAKTRGFSEHKKTCLSADVAIADVLSGSLEVFIDYVIVNDSINMRNESW